MLFSYKAQSKTGEIAEALQEAVDRLALAHDLRSRGLTPLSIREKGNAFFDYLERAKNIFSGVGVGEQIIFTKNLSGMLKAGL